MSEHAKPPSKFDPPDVGPNNDGLGPQDPLHIPHTDWGVQPWFNPQIDPPTPHQPAPTDPITPGGKPSPPSWWVPDDPHLGPAPENPFTPEAQKQIKDKHAQEEQDRLDRERVKKELEDAAKKPADEKGDFPLPQGDTYSV